MTFAEQLVVTVVDKLFIAVIVAAFGYWLKRRLEAAKREEQFRLQVTLSRLSAYKTLSALLEVTSPSGKDQLGTKDRVHLGGLLRGWYYDEGNHLFLPAVTTDFF